MIIRQSDTRVTCKVYFRVSESEEIQSGGGVGCLCGEPPPFPGQYPDPRCPLPCSTPCERESVCETKCVCERETEHPRPSPHSRNPSPCRTPCAPTKRTTQPSFESRDPERGDSRIGPPPGGIGPPRDTRVTTPSHRGTSPIRKRLPLGPYSRAMPRPLRWS